MADVARTWMAPVRQLAKSALGTVNRWLHPLRRRRALAILDDLEALPRRIVFVCHGNICRSPYAEGALRRELSGSLCDWIEVKSTGFVKPGRPSPDAALTVAAENSVPLFDHRSRVLRPDSLEARDLVFVMTLDQRSELRRRFPSITVLLLGDFDPEPAPRRRIIDPVMQPEEVFRRVYARIDRCVRTLARRLEIKHSGGHGRG